MSYLRHHILMNGNIPVHYFFNMKDRDMFVQYKTSKDTGICSTELKQMVSDYIKSLCSGMTIVIPESSSNMLIDSLGNNHFSIIRKNSWSDILDCLKQDKTIQKSQLKSIVNNMDPNNPKISSLKANQRAVVSKYIFDTSSIPDGKYVLIDDSCFTGSTLSILADQIKPDNILVLYAYIE